MYCIAQETSQYSAIIYMKRTFKKSGYLYMFN